MIDHIRKTFIIIMLLLTIPLPSWSAILLDRVVAIVDREVITWSELYRGMSMEYRAFVEGMSTEEKKAYLENIQHEFIDKLINMKLQIEEAKRSGYTVSDEEVKGAINDIRKQYQFTLQDFRNALEKDGIRYNEYKDMLRDQILISKIVANEIRSKVIVTDAEIDEYMERNKKDLPLELSYKLFEVHIAEGKADGNEKDSKSITDEIYVRIQSGEKLEEFIRDMDKEYPGRIKYTSGYIHASELRKDFLEALKNLDEGQVTSPIWSKGDVYILKIRSKELPVELDKLRDNIREMISNEKSGDLHKAWIKRLRQTAFIEIKL